MSCLWVSRSRSHISMFTYVQNSSHKPPSNMREHLFYPQVVWISGEHALRYRSGFALYKNCWFNYRVRFLQISKFGTIILKDCIIQPLKPKCLHENPCLVRDQFLEASPTSSISRTHITETTRGTFQTLSTVSLKDNSVCCGWGLRVSEN